MYMKKTKPSDHAASHARLLEETAMRVNVWEFKKLLKILLHRGAACVAPKLENHKSARPWPPTPARAPLCASHPKTLVCDSIAGCVRVCRK
jgi:hypothetical protein